MQHANELAQGQGVRAQTGDSIIAQWCIFACPDSCSRVSCVSEVLVSVCVCDTRRSSSSLITLTPSSLGLSFPSVGDNGGKKPPPVCSVTERQCQAVVGASATQRPGRQQLDLWHVWNGESYLEVREQMETEANSISLWTKSVEYPPDLPSGAVESKAGGQIVGDKSKVTVSRL